MDVWLIRHGSTVPGEEGRYQGFLDESLSEKGRTALVRAPFCPSHVYVSPAKRARETAAILFPEAEQICLPGLWEMNFGLFEGRTWKEMENDPQYREWVDGMCLGTCPGGESRAEFSDRVCKAFQSILAMEKEWQKRQTLSLPAEDASAEDASAGCQGNPDRGDFKEQGKADLFIVSHGGTQMAILEKWGCPARDYYDWQRPCGCGWKLALHKVDGGDPKPDQTEAAVYSTLELHVLEELCFVQNPIIMQLSGPYFPESDDSRSFS